MAPRRVVCTLPPVCSELAFIAERNERKPYSARNAAPPQVAMRISIGWLLIKAPSPATPSVISRMSHRMHTVTMATICARAMPCLRTKVFCGPIATSRPSAMVSPEKKAGKWNDMDDTAKRQMN